MTRRRSRIGFYLLLCVVAFWCLFPFFWLAMTSMKTTAAALNDPNLFRGPLNLQNYATVMGHGFMYNLRNSAIVATMSMVITLVLGVMLSYAISRLGLRHRNAILLVILALSLFPPVSLVPPLYEIWRNIGLLNTYPGMYLPYAAFQLPLTVTMLLTFFRSIPNEIEEAAWVDGATPFQTFWRVSLPLVAPGIFAAAIIAFVHSWNEYLLASTFAPRSLAAQTVPVAIASFTGADPYDRPIGTITAACMLVSLPMIILALVFQRRIVSGLTAGSVKG